MGEIEAELPKDNLLKIEDLVNDPVPMNNSDLLKSFVPSVETRNCSTVGATLHVSYYNFMLILL